MYHDGAGCKTASCDCRKKGKEFRGEGGPHLYRSVRNVTNWLVRINVAVLIMIVIFWVLPYEINSALRWIDIVVVISLLLLIIKLFWYFNANKNIHSFGAKKVTSPVMAAIWWFVPILFFWKPFQVTQQLWKASDPQILLIEGTEWKKATNSELVNRWWASQLVSVAAAVSFAGFVYLGYDIGQVALSDIAGITFLVGTFISTILFIQIIRQICTWQDLKSASLV